MTYEFMHIKDLNRISSHQHFHGWNSDTEGSQAMETFSLFVLQHSQELQILGR